MIICLVGKNLSNFVLTKALANKKLNLDIVYNSTDKKIKPSRILGISEDNYNYLTKIELIKFYNKEKKNFLWY